VSCSQDIANSKNPAPQRRVAGKSKRSLSNSKRKPEGLSEGSRGGWGGGWGGVGGGGGGGGGRFLCGGGGGGGGV